MGEKRKPRQGYRDREREREREREGGKIEERRRKRRKGQGGGRVEETVDKAVPNENSSDFPSVFPSERRSRPSHEKCGNVLPCVSVHRPPLSPSDPGRSKAAYFDRVIDPLSRVRQSWECVSPV